MRRTRVVAVLAAVVLVSGCDRSSEEGPGAAPSPTEQSSSAGTVASDGELWLTFDDAVTGQGDSSVFPGTVEGRFRAEVVTANGGAVASVQGPPGRGAAVAFPALCTAPVGCPRAMVEVAPDAALNPGTASFEFGASVWLGADQVTTGSNIVQKGRFGTVGGQWKLQVDSLEGEPSCVIRSGADVITVKSRVSIADSDWHQVVCRRDGEGVSISVDGVVEREPGGAGSVDNDLPIRVGSPGVGDDDDQFHGRVDDVFLSIGP